MGLHRRDRTTATVGVLATLSLPVAGLLGGRIGMALVPLPNAIAYLGIGLYAVLKRPDHLAARRILLWAVTLAIGFAVGTAFSAWWAVRGSTGVDWLMLLTLEALGWLGSVAALALFAVFPDGTYRSPVERRIVIGALLATPVLVLLQVLGSNRVTTSDLVWADAAAAPNPLAMGNLASLGAVADVVIHVGGVVLLLVGAALLVVRRWGADARTRRQLAWPLLGIAATGVAYLCLGAFNALGPAWPFWLQYVVYLPVVLFVPATLFVGMLRAELLDIRVVVRRSLLYGLLWVLITVAYVAAATWAGVVAGRRLPLAVAVATTVLVTFLAAPARSRLERIADRIVFGARVSGDVLISDLGRTLDGGAAPDDTAGLVADAVRQGLRARWVRVRMGVNEAFTGTDANAEDDAILAVPLAVDGETFGLVECGPKDTGTYTHRDRLLLETIARQGAWVARNTRLTIELSAKVAELESSRRRILRAEEVGRRRLERDLHDGVQQALVALLTRLGLVANQLKRDPALAAGTLADARADARLALEDLQDLVRGIHPALLTDRGLVAAVEERVGRLPVQGRVESDAVLRTRRLDPDLEGAAYFLVSECLANVVKHAGPDTAVVVELRLEATDLVVEVTDAGPGFEQGSKGSGSGLDGLADRIAALHGRLDVVSRPAMGTSVSARLPVPPAPRAAEGARRQGEPAHG